MDLLIRRYGRMIDISPDGQSPLPQQFVDLLSRELSYSHRTFLRQHERYSPDGTRHGNVAIESRRMYGLEAGRLTTVYGFYRRVVAVLQGAGATVYFADLTPTHHRPDRYETDWARMHRYVTFRHPVQLYCIQQVAASDQGCIFAPPAFGKTHCIEALCHLYPKAKIHIAVRPIGVARRILRQLSRSLPNIGMIGGGANAYGDRITVFVAGSLHKSDGDADIFIGDEAHQLLAEDASREIARAYHMARIYLMTASPTGRSDGTDVRMEMLGGPPVFTLTYAQGVDCGLVVPMRVRWLPIHMVSNPGANKQGVTKERWGIWRNTERNAAIAKDARESYGPDQQVLILCAKVDHAIHLWQHLPEYALCYAEQAVEDLEYYKRNHYLPAGFAAITPERREALRNSFAAGQLKKVIATDVWATGEDFPQLQVVYRADARQSEIIDTQAPARASRIYNGKEYGEVVDCADFFDDTWLKASKMRRRHYASFDWTQDWPNQRARGGSL